MDEPVHNIRNLKLEHLLKLLKAELLNDVGISIYRTVFLNSKFIQSVVREEEEDDPGTGDENDNDDQSLLLQSLAFFEVRIKKSIGLFFFFLVFLIRTDQWKRFG